MEYNLFHNFELFSENEGVVYTYKPMELIDPDPDVMEYRWTGASLDFVYGAYLMSQEPICFTGDFFPFYAPSCALHNSGEP